jgi:hypothetical protein
LSRGYYRGTMAERHLAASIEAQARAREDFAEAMNNDHTL